MEIRTQLKKFQVLQISYAIANLADGIAIVAFPLLLTLTGGSVMEVGVLAAVSIMPGLLIALPTGALIDRSSPRKIMIMTSLLRAILCLLFIGVWWRFDHNRLIVLLIAVVILSCLATIYDLAGPKILTNIFVDKELLIAANSRLQIIESLGNRFIGAPLAGFLITIGALFPIMVMVPLYFCAAGMIFILQYEATAPNVHHEKRPDFHFMTEGLRFILKSRILTYISLMTSMSNLALAGVSAIIVIYITKHLNAPPWSFGLLYACIALGGTAGALLAPRILRKFSLSFTLRFTYMVLPALVLILAFPISPFVVAVQQFILGFILTVSNVGTSTYRQSVTPHGLLGRVSSVSRIISFGSMPIGSLIGGYLATKYGFDSTFKIFAISLTFTWIVLPSMGEKLFLMEKV